MNDINYKQFYERVGKRIGWDFSRLNKIEEGKKWDFVEEVAKITKPTSKLLDIGTGGGEQILRLAKKVKIITGIDHSVGMISTAKRNFNKSGYKNVHFLRMSSAKLKFPDSSFDIVTSRHCDFYPQEVYRVLVRGGRFLTQQVSEGDKINIKNIFGRGQAYGIKDGTLKNRYIKELKNLGFKNIRTRDYNSTVYYKTEKDLIFLLKHTPIIPDFGKNKIDFETLEKFVKENMTTKGMKTNTKRFMITARK